VTFSQGIALGLLVVFVSAVWLGLNYQLHNLVNVVEGDLDPTVYQTATAESSADASTDKMMQFVEATVQEVTAQKSKSRQTRWL
jgi:hypothetical protein